ncbi:hypothetical protein LBGG_02232 [Lactobacillus gasseri MV-22]|nr:hypothetical protein LBGG_02232 [Lactobacillus gasseri MV-22]
MIFIKSYGINLERLERTSTMNEIENIKAGLTYLLDINDLKNNVTVTKDGKSHSMNVKDLKEANYDVLLQIAELLGMDVNN